MNEHLEEMHWMESMERKFNFVTRQVELFIRWEEYLKVGSTLEYDWEEILIARGLSKVMW